MDVKGFAKEEDGNGKMMKIIFKDINIPTKLIVDG